MLQANMQSSLYNSHRCTTVYDMKTSGMFFVELYDTLLPFVHTFL